MTKGSRNDGQASWRLHPMRLLLALLLLLSAPCGAWAEKRVALIIGNSSYRHAPTLANPGNDARDVSAIFKKLKFDVVDGQNLDRAGFEHVVQQFARSLEGADVGIFFYAGHGLQVGGRNYLVPVDAKLETISALDFEVVPLTLVQGTMERAAKTNIIFLDACRNNPLARNLARAMGTRSASIGRGLAPVQSGVGTLISFSTQPGNVALDGSGRNSPFAAALRKHLPGSSEDLSATLIAVRNDVIKSTKGSQVPWEHSSLTSRFFFNPRKSSEVLVAQGPGALQDSQPNRQGAAAGVMSGTWVGRWGGEGAISVTIVGNRVVEYKYRGKPVPVGNSEDAGDGIRFGTSVYSIVLEQVSPDRLSARYKGAKGVATTELTPADSSKPKEKARQAGAFDGSWVGRWAGPRGGSVLLKIARERVVEYRFRGRVIPIGETTSSNGEIAFGNGDYSVRIKPLASGQLSASYRGPKGKATALLERQ